jgi:UDP-glucose 4-epimerase
MLVASADRAREVLGWNPTRTDLTGIVADAWAFAHARHAANTVGRAAMGPSRR